MNKYTVEYAIDSDPEENGDLVSHITDTVTEMQRNGIDIEFVGASQQIDGHGKVVAVTVRYVAPSKGTVGRLNCRADLPASASPQLATTDKTALASYRVAVASR